METVEWRGIVLVSLVQGPDVWSNQIKVVLLTPYSAGSIIKGHKCKDARNRPAIPPL